MSKQQIEHIIRAWKDQDYRNSLSKEERAQLPENPAGMIELEASALKGFVGGNLNYSKVYNNSACYCSVILNP